MQQVFRVHRDRLEPGTLVRPYFIGAHAALVAEAQDAIEQGAPQLLALLRGSDVLKSVDTMLIVLEAVFEAARTEICSTAPSRLECTFVWPTLELAQSFQREYLPNGHLQTCDIIAGTLTTRDGALLPPGIDINVPGAAELAVELAAARARADRYWRSEHVPARPELMVHGEVRVASA